MQPDSESYCAAVLLGLLADPLDLLRDGGRWFTPPRQVHIGMPRRHRAGGLRATAKVQRWHRVRWRRQIGFLDVNVFALVRDGFAGPQPAHHLEELIAALIPRVLVEMVTEGTLLVSLSADHDVEQDPTRRVLGERSRHLSRQRRADQPPRAERHQEGQR